MRALILVLAPCLFHLGAAAAGFGVLDQGSLFQKSSKLQPADADARASILLSAFVKQVAGMEIMLQSSNATRKDMLEPVVQELLALKDKEFADLHMSTFTEVLALVGNHMKVAFKQRANLKEARKDASEEESCKLLAAFLKMEQTETFELVDAVFEKLKALKAASPTALAEALHNAGGDNILDVIADDTKQSVDHVFKRIDMAKASVKKVMTDIKETVHKTFKTATKPSHCSFA